MLKKGKLPLSDKIESSEQPMNPDSMFGNDLQIPPVVSSYLKSQGLEPRWVDSKRMYTNGGYHTKGWVPVKLPQEITKKLSLTDWKYGNDPDGILRRGSVILAAKTGDQVKEHQRYLKNRADRFKLFDKKQAQKIANDMKSNNVAGRIIEGYEENS